MTLLSAFLLSALATSSATPQAEVRNVRIFSPKILVSREKPESDVLVGGQVRVDMSFAKKTVCKQVPRLVCLCESDAGLTVHTAFLGRPRTCDGMGRSGLGAYGIPEDRYLWKKHPQKFKYADIR